MRMLGLNTLKSLACGIEAYLFNAITFMGIYFNKLKGVNNMINEENMSVPKLNSDKKKLDKCYVIMPIGELPEYPQNHFKRIYKDIFDQAIRRANLEPKRADDNNSSHIIQVDIIKDIIEAPIALCDLSTRNPNVLFELGIRQAFDKPVVLVQEVGTPRIFDISTINTIEYRKERIYHEVLEDIDKIYKAIIATLEDSSNNSIMKLVNIEKANTNTIGKLDENQEMKFLIKNLSKEISELKQNYTFNNLKYECKNDNTSYIQNDKINEILRFMGRVNDSSFNTFSEEFKKQFLEMAKEFSDLLYPCRHNQKLYLDLYNQLNDFINRFNY
jgi:hypothetical protein